MEKRNRLANNTYCRKVKLGNRLVSAIFAVPGFGSRFDAVIPTFEYDLKLAQREMLFAKKVAITTFTSRVFEEMQSELGKKQRRTRREDSRIEGYERLPAFDVLFVVFILVVSL